MKRIIFLALPTLVALAGCSSTPEITSFLTPYRIDVRQGNFVTQEMMAQLKAGQTKDQVRFILGTPLLVDMFHGERWDYIYRFQPGHGEAQQRRITVYFSEGKLVRVSGDVVANELTAVPPKAGSPAPVNGNGHDPAGADSGPAAMKLDPALTAPGGK